MSEPWQAYAIAIFLALFFWLTSSTPDRGPTEPNCIGYRGCDG